MKQVYDSTVSCSGPTEKLYYTKDSWHCFIPFPPNVHLFNQKSTMNKTIGIDLKVKDLSEWMEMIVQAHSCGIHSKPS